MAKPNYKPATNTQNNKPIRSETVCLRLQLKVICLQGLLAVYLVVVVILVRRQINEVEEEEAEEREEIVVMTDQQGNTDAKPVDSVVFNNNEIFL